ncbi:C2 calcium-dependent domain-containing protein 4A [Pteropus alecto]|uniref:C2 calcium-dependent domain-containing protein 4A n=1 Tax=Pteropus alecto TaxID=9402 RepID=UPI000D53C272|nr:C2 calcium-dependent domain-containing protein 4A [Pteropus alecto]
MKADQLQQRSYKFATCRLMWCLETLYLGPKRLLRGVKRRLQRRTRRITATTPVACANVLTPDRIPEFCIPPRLAPYPALATLRDFWGNEAGTDDSARRTDSDPRSQAALSLPHLPRALTGTVTLGRAGGALRLAVEYSRASGRLRIRLLRPEGQAGGDAEPRAVGCRVSFVLQPPGKTRQQRSAVVRRSRKAVFDQDFWFDGLSEDEVRRLAVRVKAENKGRGLERGRLLGQGELLLGSLLLL